MKKVKKLFIVMLTLIISLMTLTACGSDKTESDNDEKKVESGSTSEVEEKTSANTKFIDDNDSYYFIYDGVEIKAGDQIADLDLANLSVLDTQLDKELDAEAYSSCEITNAEGKSIFNATAYNKDSLESTISDSCVGGVSFGTQGVSRDSKVADMEVYGGIKIGSTAEELIEVFGEPDNSDESEYVYESEEASRYYRFDITDGEVTRITWMNRTF